MFLILKKSIEKNVLDGKKKEFVTLSDYPDFPDFCKILVEVFPILIVFWIFSLRVR